MERIFVMGFEKWNGDKMRSKYTDNSVEQKKCWKNSQCQNLANFIQKYIANE